MSNPEEDLPEAEWSILMPAETLGGETIQTQIKADAEERARIIKRLGLLSLDDLTANLKFSRERGHVVHITGQVKAKLAQECVISLEPVLSEINTQFQAWYADQDSAVLFEKKRKQRELQNEEGEIPMLEEKDDPEPIIDGHIDVAELTVQHLSLSLDPYPHAEGVKYDLSDEEMDEQRRQDPEVNPFAALKDWKNNKSE